jgi:DNA-binding beta-propeller fold protein YncE
MRRSWPFQVRTLSRPLAANEMFNKVTARGNSRSGIINHLDVRLTLDYLENGSKSVQSGSPFVGQFLKPAEETVYKKMVFSVTMKKHFRSTSLLLASMVVVAACSKKSDQTTEIRSIRPMHGPIATLDTISGNGFGTVAANDSVYYNGHSASIVSISNNQLVVNVPKLAGTGSVTVSVNGHIVTGPVFTYDTTYATTTYAGGITSPYGICIDPSNGNLFVANYADNTVIKITQDGTVSHFASGFSLPGGIAIDGGGNLYVTNYGNGTISKITQAGVVSTAVSSISNPAGITLDATGNLYVTNFGNGTISTVTPNGTITSIPTGITYTTGIARDGSGNLYVTNAAGNSISKISPAGAVSSFATNVHQPSDIAIDAMGNLYTTDPVNNTITKITPSGVVKIIVTGLGEPDPIAVDRNGNFFVGSMNIGAVVKLSPQ